MITLTTFVHCTSGGESLHKNRSASGSNLTIIEKETGTRLKGGLFATYVIPFVFLATSSLSNAIYLTVMSTSGLDSVKTTIILFWAFLFGSPVLWFLSVIFEDVIYLRVRRTYFCWSFVGSAQHLKVTFMSWQLNFFILQCFRWLRHLELQFSSLCKWLLLLLYSLFLLDFQFWKF